MKRLLLVLPISLLVAVLHSVLFLSSFGSRFEPFALDLCSWLRGPVNADAEAVLIAMDETSYSLLDLPLSQAWPRALHAKLLERLAQAGAKRVVFDVLFLGEGADPAADRALASAMSKIPTILGSSAILKDHSSASGSFKIEELELPYEPFQKSSESYGLVGFPDDFGQIRRFLAARSKITREIPSLSEAAAGIFKRDPSVLPHEDDFIHFYGPRGSIPTYSYYQVIDSQRPLPEQLLKDKIVFVGQVLQTEVGPSQKDIFNTPYGMVFGTEVHATATLNLLKHDWIRRSGRSLEAALLGLFCLLGSLLILLFRPLWGLVVTLASFLAWAVGAYILFLNGVFLPGLILVTFFFPLLLLSSTLYFYFVTRKAELKMHSAFELYLSPQMAKELAQNKGALSLGGEKIWATALFTDIEGFTTITEEMPAERVSSMLNAYFSEVMNAIFEKQGTLIKFIGDAVFALWGAPIKINNHAERACETALAIQKGVGFFNASGRFPPLHTRIGINTGPMVVGNLGSSRRFDYTAIGDSVNLASRIEGLNKHFGSRILISGSTKKELGNSLCTLPAGITRAAGKRETIELYFLLDSEPRRDVAATWKDAILKFSKREFEEAEKLFAEVAAKEGWLKKACELYLAEISVLKQNPPGTDWKGEISFSTK